ncbi:MAG TPA: hypothetical protein PLN68_05095, partial [Elusimicrobiales bacterium]|nr:hypothetical protein [Elusimicrobiales bacterium]
MSKKKIKIILICSFLFSLNLFSQEVLKFEEKKITDKKIFINSPISGVTQAYDEYNVTAPFDGQVTAIMPALFDIVNSSDAAIRMVSGEVSALLKTAKDENERKEILKRWKGMFNYSDIKIPEKGIVTKIYVKKDAFVNKGELLLTVARKMRVIAKNTEKIYVEIEKGLNGIIEDSKLGKYKITLKDFIPQEKYFYRLLFDFDEIPEIKIGEQVSGIMMIAERKSARVVPSEDVINYDGKKYILIEFEPGIITETDTEILGFKLNYLK